MRKTRHESMSGTVRFTLWREVVVAYVAPTLIAGVGGLVSGQGSLLVSACTSIGISSAVVAALIGGWLQRRGLRHAWLRSGHRFVVIATVAIAAALLGGLVGWLVNVGASAWLGAHQWPWPDGLGVDLPVSAAIAATIVTWRWRAAYRTATSSDTSARTHRPMMRERGEDPGSRLRGRGARVARPTGHRPWTPATRPRPPKS
jgi:MFS family permease